MVFCKYEEVDRTLHLNSYTLLHVVGQVPAAASGKKRSKKHADKVYGGLESARSAPGRRVSSNRYISEPRKGKDDPKSVYVPMNAGAASEHGSAAEAGKNINELQMPVVAENDYLLPQSGATAPPYVDFMFDKSHGIISSFVLLLY